jgi:hypothetical protein
VKTNVMTATTTSAMIIVAKTATTTRSILHHHCQKGATPMACSKPPTEKSTSSLVVAKRLKATGSSDQTQGRSDTSTLKLHDLYVSRISQSLSLRKIIGSIYLTSGPTRWSSIP